MVDINDKAAVTKYIVDSLDRYITETLEKNSASVNAPLFSLINNVFNRVQNKVLSTPFSFEELFNEQELQKLITLRFLKLKEHFKNINLANVQTITDLFESKISSKISSNHTMIEVSANEIYQNRAALWKESGKNTSTFLNQLIQRFESKNLNFDDLFKDENKSSLALLKQSAGLKDVLTGYEIALNTHRYEKMLKEALLLSLSPENKKSLSQESFFRDKKTSAHKRDLRKLVLEKSLVTPPNSPDILQNGYPEFPKK